jgi:RNA polymerase-binding transcription factor DksA
VRLYGRNANEWTARLAAIAAAAELIKAKSFTIDGEAVLGPDGLSRFEVPRGSHSPIVRQNVKRYNYINRLSVWERDDMVDRANHGSYVLHALRKEAEGQDRRIEEQLRQLRGHCVECGGPIGRVAGADFVMMTGCSVCQACYPRTPRRTLIRTGLARLALPTATASIAVHRERSEKWDRRSGRQSIAPPNSASPLLRSPRGRKRCRSRNLRRQAFERPRLSRSNRQGNAEDNRSTQAELRQADGGHRDAC